MGVATVTAVTMTHTTFVTLFPTLPEVVKGLNIGLVALRLSLNSTAAVSVMTRPHAAYAE